MFCLHASVSVCHLHAWCLRKPEEGIGFLWNWRLGVCEPLWVLESNPYPQQERLVLLGQRSLRFFQRLLNHNTNPGHLLRHFGEAMKGIDAVGTQPGPNRELTNSPVL